MPSSLFLPPPLVPLSKSRIRKPQTWPHSSQTPPSPSFPSLPHPTRRQLLQLSLVPLLSPLFPTPTQASTPEILDHVFLDISIAGRPSGRITLGLYSALAPLSISTFKSLITATLRAKSGITAGYKYSTVSKVVPGLHIQLGKIKQIDALNQQPGTPQRQQLLVEPPLNPEQNSLRHDREGLVSVKKGGGMFEFLIALAQDSDADEEWMVVGEVLDGMDVVRNIAKVPVNRKTIRDGYRNVGKVIGDARANVDVC